MPSPAIVDMGQSVVDSINNLVKNLTSNLKNEYKKLAKLNCQLRFINRCLAEGLYPKHTENLVNLRSINIHGQNEAKFLAYSNTYKTKILKLERKDIYFKLKLNHKKISDIFKQLNRHIDNREFFKINKRFEDFYHKEYGRLTLCHHKKLKNLRNASIRQYMDHNLDDEKFVQNLSGFPIPDNVIKGLQLGPKFGFIDNNEKTILDILANVESNLHKIKNEKRRKVCRNKVTSCIMNFINKKYNFSGNNKCIEKLISSHIKAAKIFKKENKDLIILNSDKANSVVVMNKTDYNKKALDVLGDTSKYKLITNVKDPVSKNEKQINQFLHQAYDSDMLTKKEYENLKSKNGIPSYLYFLAKSHKNDCPLRPVITSYDTPTKNLSKFLASVLEFMVCHDNRVKNSLQVINNIKDLVLLKEDVLVSFDAVNLFPSLPLEIIKRRIREKWYLINRYTNFNYEFFISAFEKCLDLNVFMFDGKFYKQVSGCPIGGCMSSVVSDIFIDFVHDEVFSKFPIKKIFYYVDDSLCIVDKSYVNDILDTLNNLHPSIKYTCELEQEGSINFLDITLIRETSGKLRTNAYKKIQKSSRSINFYSHHPNYQKYNLIKNEITRMLDVSHPDFVDANIKAIKEKFLVNNYPNKIVEQLCVETRNNYKNYQITMRRSRTTNEKLVYTGSIPFVPGLSESIRGILRRYEVNITFKIKKPLISVTNNKFNPDLLEKSGLVYGIPCASCKGRDELSLYVGETGRKLRVRLREHFYSVGKSLPSSALSFHALEEKHDFDFENVRVLCYEKDMQKRRFLESYFIHLYDKFSVNLKTEYEKSSLVYSDVFEKIKKPLYKPSMFYI